MRHNPSLHPSTVIVLSGIRLVFLTLYRTRENLAKRKKESRIKGFDIIGDLAGAYEGIEFPLNQKLQFPSAAPHFLGFMVDLCYTVTILIFLWR